MESSNWFTNAVGQVATTLAPHELLALMLRVEEQFGRVRDGDAIGYQDRSLDLDLLYYGEAQLSTVDLVLPHPHIASRLFVLAPLAEIAAHHRDQASGLTIGEMHDKLVSSLQLHDNAQQTIVKAQWQ